MINSLQKNSHGHLSNIQINFRQEITPYFRNISTSNEIGQLTFKNAAVQTSKEIGFEIQK